MKKYRLKKEAREYFEYNLRKSIKTLDEWTDLNVSTKALEEVELIYIEHGIETSENGRSLSGWSNSDGEKKARIDFTLNILDYSNRDYEKITSSENINNIILEMEAAASMYIKAKTK